MKLQLEIFSRPKVKKIQGNVLLRTDIVQKTVSDAPVRHSRFFFASCLTGSV